MTAPDAQHAGVPLRQISLNTFYIADSDPTWIALPLSEDAQQARNAALRHMFVTFREFVLTMEWDDEDFDAAVRVANGILGIGGPA